MLVTCQQMQQAEEAAIGRGVSAAALMEEAGKGIAGVVRQFFPRPGTLVLCLGKGNNAGDALVAARELHGDGWRLLARLAFPVLDFKELPARHWRELAGKITAISGEGALGGAPGLPVVALDGLLGIGAAGPLGGALRKLAAEMNGLRHTRHATVVAMDIPSGLDGDTGLPGEGGVMADITVTVGGVKAGLVADAAANHVGRLALVELSGLTSAQGDEQGRILTAGALRAKLPRRPFDFHKGQAGRVGIIAGSREFSGAAALAALGALRGGAGLVTVLAKEDAHALIAAKTAAEAMVKPVGDYREALTMGFDVIAAGPGTGMAADNEIATVIRQFGGPMVIDADALTMLGGGRLRALHEAAGPRLLTPHPGEMARIADASHSRRETAERFAAAHPKAVLLLKACRSIIAAKGQPACCNTTGHPGMATGGMGDVLTGLCAALIAQGASPFDAACLGAWLSGRAAELAVSTGGQSQESLLAGDVAGNLGSAFGDLKAGVW